MSTASSGTASPHLIEPTDTVRVFIAYRRADGQACANWLQGVLHEQPISTVEGRVAKLKTYFDVHAPAISDWRDKWKADLAVARAFILVCSPLAATEQPKSEKNTPDWLYEEIRWWIANRRTAPILVEAWPDGECRVPAPVAAVWPYAQRLPWSHATVGDEAHLLVQRIIEGLVLSARRIDHEELRRLRIRNRLLQVLALVALALAVGLFVAFQREASARADAERNLRAFYGPALRTVQQSIQQSNIATAQDRLDAIPERLRGWEWHYLRSLADQSVAFWPTTSVNHVTYGPSGMIVSGDENGSVRIHDARTLRVTAEKQVHDSSVRSIVEVDATHVVSTGLDDTLREWDVASGTVRTIARFEITDGPLKVSHRHSLLVTAGADRTVRVFQLAAGAETLVANHVFPWAVKSVDFSPDGETVAVLGLTHLDFYRWRSDTIVREHEAKEGGWDHVSYSLDGTRLLLIEIDGSRTIVSAETFAALPFEIEGFETESLMLAAHQGRVATSTNLAIDISGVDSRRLIGHTRDVHWQAFSPDGRYLVSAGWDGVRLWDLNRPPHADRLPGGVDAVAASPDGRWVVGVSNGFPYVYIWDLQSHGAPRIVRIDRLDNAAVDNVRLPLGAKCLAFYPDGKRFVVGYSTGLVRTYRLEPFGVSRSVQTDREILTVAVSPDGRQLAAAGLGFAAVWDEQSADPWLVPQGTRSVSFTRPGLLAVGSSNLEPPSLFTIWDTFQQALERPSEPAGDKRPNWLASSPDGAFVLAEQVGTVSLWDTARGMRIRTVSDEPNRSTTGQAIFSPDGQRILLSGEKPVIWDTEGNELFEFDTPGWSVAWAANRVILSDNAGITVYNPQR